MGRAIEVTRSTGRVAPLPYLEYSSIATRPRLTLPGNARVAFWIAPNIEAYEFIPHPNRYARPFLRMTPPDVLSYSYLDYGNRVGFWRMLEILDRYPIRPSVSLNVAVLELYPEIAEAMLQRGWSFFSHGTYNTRFLYGMTKAEEKAWVQENVEVYERATGQQLKGMFGPFITQTPRSMSLWREAGVEYVVDWFLDDQPVTLRTAAGDLVNVPYGFETNDALVMGGLYKRGGSFEADYFAQLCKDQFDVLYEEGAAQPRVMCVALHPFVIGTPARARCLEEILTYILGHSDVWVTTAEEIALHYRAGGASGGTPAGEAGDGPELSGYVRPAHSQGGEPLRSNGTRTVAPCYYDWSPLPRRSKLEWPKAASVAVALLLSVEYLELAPPPGSVVAPSALYGGPYPDVFDPTPVSAREYGNRVGAFRIMGLLDELGLPASLAVDVGVAANAGAVVAAARARNYEIIAHGIAASRVISEDMAEEEERAYVQRTISDLEALTGTRPRGWLGADYGESSRTVRILSDYGLSYVCDWANDEQPYDMTAGGNQMTCLPVAADADAVFTTRMRGAAVPDWADCAVAAFDRLRVDGRISGRVWVMNIPAYHLGQPYRFKHLARVLRHVAGAGDVWVTTPTEIIDWFRRTTSSARGATSTPAATRGDTK